MEKYYAQRYTYFSRFDEGIQIIDDESWFSVTPELIAKHQARRFSGKEVVVDAFCGVAGNAIQFALNPAISLVLAFDIRADYLEQAFNNACVYGVQDKIRFVHGDFFEILPRIVEDEGLSIDGIFLSPPWGGPALCSSSKTYSLTSLLPVDGYTLLNFCRSYCSSVLLFLPRNTDIRQIIGLADEHEWFQIEQNYLNDRLKALSVYFGHFSDC